MNNFTPRDAQVLQLARKEADRFNHNYVGTEHLLFGWIKLGDSLAELNQAEQEMLSAYVIVIEAVGFFPGELQHLLGTGSKIVHCSAGAGFEPLPASLASLLISGFGKAFKRSRMIWARRWSRSSALSFCSELF